MLKLIDSLRGTALAIAALFLIVALLDRVL